MTIQSHHLHTHGPDPMRPAGKPHKAQWKPEVHRFDLDEYCNEQDWRVMYKVWEDEETKCRAKAEKYNEPRL